MMNITFSKKYVNKGPKLSLNIIIRRKKKLNFQFKVQIGCTKDIQLMNAKNNMFKYLFEY